MLPAALTAARRRDKDATLASRGVAAVDALTALLSALADAPPWLIMGVVFLPTIISLPTADGYIIVGAGFLNLLAMVTFDGAAILAGFATFGAICFVGSIVVAGYGYYDKRRRSALLRDIRLAVQQELMQAQSPGSNAPDRRSRLNPAYRWGGGADDPPTPPSRRGQVPLTPYAPAGEEERRSFPT